MIKLSNNSHRIGGVSALVCSTCYFIGLVTLVFIAPDLYDFPAGRLRVIDQYGVLLYLWYFVVFALVGICVLFINYSLLRLYNREANWIVIVTTLMAYLSASYLFIICSIEIISNEFFLAEHSGVTTNKNQLTEQIYTVLTNLRMYTEWTLDVWLILINAMLFNAKIFSRLLHAFGLITGLFGILILNPTFQPYAMNYVGAIGLWFLLIGVKLLLQGVKTKI